MSSFPSSSSNQNDIDEAEALKEVQEILNQTRPKHLGDGIYRGVGEIVGGGIGAVGIVVLSPIQATMEGYKEGGVIGGTVGMVGGTLVGALQAANVAAGAVISSAAHVVRGAAATPEAVMAPSKGKWFNENEGAWVETNLTEAHRWMSTQDMTNDDILGHIRALWKDSSTNADVKNVVDTHYYDALEVSPNVDESTVRRQYYILARRYSPDRAGQGNDVENKFREIGTAYVVLSNPEFRERYDKFGIHFMDYDDDDDARSQDSKKKHTLPLVDPMVLYNVLFGSDKFAEYIGTLGAATTASVGDDSPISKAQARLLQKRRVTELALKLAERLEQYVQDQLPMARANYKTEAEYLTKASYGTELTHTIGQIYSLTAAQFLGSLSSGIGMPSIMDWAKNHHARLKCCSSEILHGTKTIAGDSNTTAVKSALESTDYTLQPTRRRTELEKEMQETGVMAKYMQSLWSTTVVDLTNTLHETCQMVLFDSSVSSSVRKKRAMALKEMGDIFANQPRPKGPNFAMEGQLAYEEVAFAAMLETCARKEAWRRSAHRYDQEAQQ